MKKNKTFSSIKFDNDDVFTANLINENYADFYFRQIQLTADVLDQGNVRLSPIVGYTSMRLLQCIHRKNEINNRDILSGLKDIDFGFWLKFFLTFLILTLALSLVYFSRNHYYKRKVSFSRKLNMIIMFLFIFYVRMITRQSNNRKIYGNLYGVRYLLLTIVIMVSIVLHQLFFYFAFLNLKFSNTTFILRDLDQVLKDPELYPCFLESETVVQSKINNTNSLSYKLYKHRTPVCFLSSVFANTSPRAPAKANRDTNANALSRLLTNVLIGSDEFVEFFGYLFCNNYSEFIRTLLGQMLKKTLNKDLPLFWNPTFKSEENLQAFFISGKSPKHIQGKLLKGDFLCKKKYSIIFFFVIKDAIYFQFVYSIYEHGWVWFLKYKKHKIDNNEFGTCFTSDFSRVSFPYRFSQLIPLNFSIIARIGAYTYSIGLACFFMNWIIAFLDQHVQIKWIKT